MGAKITLDVARYRETENGPQRILPLEAPRARPPQSQPCSWSSLGPRPAALSPAWHARRCPGVEQLSCQHTPEQHSKGTGHSFRASSPESKLEEKIQATPTVSVRLPVQHVVTVAIFSTIGLARHIDKKRAYKVPAICIVEAVDST